MLNLLNCSAGVLTALLLQQSYVVEFDDVFAARDQNETLD